MVTPKSASTEVELVAKIRAGEAGAEEELVQRYRRGIAIILRRMLRGRPEAEDLSQETFRIALTKIRQGDLRDSRKLSGFICSLARNLALDHLRREARRNPEPDQRAIGHSEITLGNQLHQLLTNEKALFVRQVLAELDVDRDREMLFRFYIAEEEKDGICRDLGLSSLHFNRVLHRARRRYRQLYEERTVSR